MTVKLLWWNTLTIHQCEAKFSQWRDLYTSAFCNQFGRVGKQRTPRHKWYRKLLTSNTQLMYLRLLTCWFTSRSPRHDWWQGNQASLKV
jgi:hypothetical protein